MSVTVDNIKTLYSDVDDTLAMHNLSDYAVEEHISIDYTHGPMVIVPNKKNINLLTKFYKLGYTIILWSKTGGDWAQLVGKAIGIDHMVTLYVSKPMFLLDDKEFGEWIGPRLWRDPQTGEGKL